MTWSGSAALAKRSSASSAAACATPGLSSRALHAVIKLARTVADLDGCEQIATAHVHEALQYRRYGDVDIYWHYD